MMFGLHLQYALHITSFAEQPISNKYLSRFRKVCYDYETLYGLLKWLLRWRKTTRLAVGKVFARVAWYDNDITCMLQRHVDSGVLLKETPYEEAERTVRVFTRNYYNVVGEYMDKINEHEKLDKIDMSFKRCDDGIYIQFKLPFTLIFDVLDSIAFEVKLVLNHNELRVLNSGGNIDNGDVVYCCGKHRMDFK